MNGTRTKLESEDNKDCFAVKNFDIPSSLVRNLEKKSISTLFEIQAKSFDKIYNGKDFVGRARTGQGKTLAFVLPVMSKIINARKTDINLYTSKSNSPLVLVLCPVRELAAQVAKVFEETCGNEVSVCTVYGGVPYAKQQHMLRRGAEVVIGTCGRIKDLLEKNYLFLDKVKFAILDEVDEMLNIGFADDVEKILSHINLNAKNKKEKEHQVLLFSATLPKWVHRIACQYLEKGYEEIDLVGDSKLQTSSTISHLTICTHFPQREAVLAAFLEANMLQEDRAIIFAERKTECNELAQGSLKQLSCRVIHGDISQKDRSATIEGFRRGDFRLLVATDVAARGINVPGVTLVVQLDPPSSHETYVHRSGRTGRAGAKGRSVLFYTPQKSGMVEDIQRKARITFQRVGCPPPLLTVKKSVEKFKDMVSSLSQSTTKLLKEPVEKLLKEGNSEELLMAALVLLSGGKGKFANRSLLCGSLNFVTFCCFSESTTVESEVVRNIRDLFGTRISHSIKNFTLFKDGKGAAFDMDENYAEDINLNKDEEDSFRGELRFEIATELPPLASFRINGRGGYNNNNSGGGRSWGRNKRSDRNYGNNRQNGRKRTGNWNNNSGNKRRR